MITIVDYGMGNVGAVLNMFRHIGVPAEITSARDKILEAQKLVLPGVGAFDHAIANLHGRGLFEVLNEVVVRRQTPVLGICLGMQLLSTSSEEGERAGFGWIAARTVRFVAEASRKIPHMGWREVTVEPHVGLFASIERPKFYFVHSYHVVCDNESDVIATASYGHPFTAAIQSGHVMGVQFHPEKSHKFGMQLLRNFTQVAGRDATVTEHG